MIFGRDYVSALELPKVSMKSQNFEKMDENIEISSLKFDFKKYWFFKARIMNLSKIKFLIKNIKMYNLSTNFFYFFRFYYISSKYNYLFYNK